MVRRKMKRGLVVKEEVRNIRETIIKNVQLKEVIGRVRREDTTTTIVITRNVIISIEIEMRRIVVLIEIGINIENATGTGKINIKTIEGGSRDRGVVRHQEKNIGDDLERQIETISKGMQKDTIDLVIKWHN